MLLAANVLLVLSGLPLLLLAASRQRSGPEGPVGAHLVTGPLALSQAVALGLGLAAGGVSAFGAAGGWLWLIPVGQVVGLTLLPVLALEPRHGARARLAVWATVVGNGLAIDGARVAPGAQWGGVALASVGALVGYGLLVAWFGQSMRNAARVAEADAARMSEFEEKQAAFQLGEWKTVPADAPLWRLVQFTHSFHPDVKRECLERIAAFPDIDQAMSAVLTSTGWADEALGCIRDHYPRSRAALAPALTAYLEKEAPKWRETLDGAPMPGSYYGNVMKFVQVAACVQQDGGDMRAAMREWVGLLQGKPGLGDLAREARRVAEAPR